MIDDLASELLEEGATALMLIGSQARADHRPNSDYDFYALCEGPTDSFKGKLRRGVLTEVHYRTPAAAEQRIRAYKDLYSFLEGQVLHDSKGELQFLKEVAEDCLKNYRTPPENLHKLQHWLQTVQLKLHASRAAKDDAHTGFLVSTTTWPLLESLFALNHRPTPSSSAVKAYLPTLERKPEQLEVKLEALYIGDLQARATALQNLINSLATAAF